MSTPRAPDWEELFDALDAIDTLPAYDEHGEPVLADDEDDHR